ncbi:MAG: PAS domain S-box protein, partial [Ferrovum sp.]|nr:PAS domain S-box protein [Ferrovum sp.]
MKTGTGKLTEDEVRLRLAQIVESSNDAIISTTLDGVVESWNAAAEKLFGYTPNEAIGQSILPLFVPPEYAEEVKRKLNANAHGQHMGPVDTVRRRKDGALVDVSVMGSPIVDNSGKVVGVSINFRDISEHKADEAKISLFRELLDHSNDAIELLDPATLRFIDVNETECRVLGYSREELLAM